MFLIVAIPTHHAEWPPHISHNPLTAMNADCKLQRAGNNTLRPVTIRQIINADQPHPDADFALDGVPAGENLAAKFKAGAHGVWVWELSKPLAELKAGKLTVSVRDRQGNETRIERAFGVGK